MLALTAGTILLTVNAIRSVRQSIVRHAGGWTTVARLLPLIAPLLMLVTIHRLVGFLYRGKDVAWIQVPYLYPTCMVLLVVLSFAGLIVFVARLAGLERCESVAAPPVSW